MRRNKAQFVLTRSDGQAIPGFIDYADNVIIDNSDKRLLETAERATIQNCDHEILRLTNKTGGMLIANDSDVVEKLALWKAVCKDVYTWNISDFINRGSKLGKNFAYLYEYCPKCGAKINWDKTRKRIRSYDSSN